MGLTDSAAVAKCVEAGTGETVELSLGGKLDYLNASPHVVSALVHRIVPPDETFPFGGTMVVLRLPLPSSPSSSSEGPAEKKARTEADGSNGTFQEGMTIVISERRAFFHCKAHFSRVGLTPEEANIVVVKLGYLEPELQAMAAYNILCLSPGAVAAGHVNQLEYKYICNPIYPRDKDMEWSASAATAKTFRAGAPVVVE